MKLFTCQNCMQLLYFENDRCEKCHAELGYLPLAEVLSVVEGDGSSVVAMGEPVGRYRRCANSENGVCNWMIRSDEEGQYCIACRTNRVLADVSNPTNLQRWRVVERAKRHLFYTLMRLGLTIRNRQDDPEFGLAFDLLVPECGTAAPVLTGHDHGVITLNLIEADDGRREQIRQEMAEPYRTVLGHLRHEIGHYFWDKLVDRGRKFEVFRASFGDERVDYDSALAIYYANGPVAEWQNTFVSAYASAHPWEDFAETWAHYLHIFDTLEMAASFGLQIKSSELADGLPTVDLKTTKLESADIGELISQWLPVTYAVNSINRCMGQPDLYPFILAPVVIAKLGIVHDLVHRRLRGDDDGPSD